MNIQNASMAEFLHSTLSPIKTILEYPPLLNYIFTKI
jgi:hypothetical protein